MTVSAWLTIAATLTGFAAAILLYYASIDVPHDQQTWKGQSANELTHRHRQRFMKNLGFLAAVLAVVFGVGAVMTE